MRIALSAAPLSVLAVALVAVSASCIMAFLLAVIVWPLVQYVP
jgi:hypothetical protein